MGRAARMAVESTWLHPEVPESAIVQILPRPPESPPSSSVPASSSAPKILSVDDAPLNLFTMRALLEPLGYLIEDAQSGEEALSSVVGATEPRPCLAV